MLRSSKTSTLPSRDWTTLSALSPWGYQLIAIRMPDSLGAAADMLTVARNQRIRRDNTPIHLMQMDPCQPAICPPGVLMVP